MTLEAPGQVLSTMERDGSRRWIKPRVSQGRFLTRRRLVAYFLMALFFVLPFVRNHAGVPALGINGRPLFLLDIIARKFTLFGYTFLPTDTFLLALAMLLVFISIFLFTAIYGRLWCGWACPQTVYMEFLYRPIERLLNGTRGRGGEAKHTGFLRQAGYFSAALIVTAIPVHTFLAYFVGVENLSHWIFGSPFQHPTAFLVMAATTLLMFFDFYWFREQLCVIACPYGRFQSVLLDKLSVIVSYDRLRGEPRGKAQKNTVSLPIANTSENQKSKIKNPGDCVDCHMCVTTCPTGIDIRNGLQMECVNCTQCIDACDAVMDKLHRPRGLIRYSSQAALEAAETGAAKPRKLRFRVVFYPAVMTVLAIIWALVFINKGEADVAVLRNASTPYAILTTPAGPRVANTLRLKITNRTPNAARYSFELIDLPDGKIDVAENPVTVAAGGSQTVGFVIEVPPATFQLGTREVFLRVTDGNTYTAKIPVRLLGPMTVADSQEEAKP